jgi:hypothetical protein
MRAAHFSLVGFGPLLPLCVGLWACALAGPPSAAASTSTQFAPVVTFATPGSKSITLDVCNRSGCDTVTRTVMVLNPSPLVTGAAGSPLTAEVGQLVRLSGTGSGIPPRTFKWQIYSGLSLVSEIPGASTFWDTSGRAAGVYTAVLVLANSVGTAQSLPVPIVLLPRQGTRFYTLPPCRILDTRTGTALTSADNPRLVPITGVCGVPANARAIAANVTVVSSSLPSYITLFPGNYPLPATSTINFRAGRTLANSAVLPLATDGAGTIAITPALLPGASLHLLIDVSGYFAVPPLLRPAPPR